MNLITIITTAFALAMDAFAVSISSGAAIKKIHVRHALKVALFFGVFQAVMPLLGWSFGLFAADIIQSFDHWVAFILLAAVGGKMIWESRKTITECKDEDAKNPLNLHVLIMLSFATSIDAAAVGITLSFLQISILLPILIIGIITFIISFIGMYVGMYVCEQGGDFFSKKIEFAGGLVLIGIGIKILIEHIT
jgi:manganese efflux pump family protein